MAMQNGSRSSQRRAPGVERGVREALLRAERTGAPWGALLLAVHYAFTLTLQLAAPEVGGAGGPLRALLSVSVCAGLAWYWWRGGLRWPAGAATTALVSVVLANTVARAIVDPQPWLGTRLALLFLGASLIAVSWRALIGMILAGLATWALALVLAPLESNWIYETLFVLFAGGLALIAYHVRLLMVRDLVASHEALASSDAHLRRVQKIAGVASFEWDLERDTLTWSDELLRFGDSERGRGSLSAFVDEVVHPDDRELARDLVAFCSRTESAFQREVRLLRPDGEVRWIEALGVSMRNPSGRPMVVGVLLDRTVQRQAQAREADLLRVLSRRGHVSLVDEVAALLADVLQRPLTAIASHARAGLRRLEPGAESGDALRAIGEEVARAADVVRTVVDAAPRQASKREPVDVVAVASQVARLIDLEARERGVTVRVQREDGPGWAHASPDPLAQVFANLLRNGLEAIAEQGAATGDLVVTIAAGAPGWLDVSVSDSGKGVPLDRAEAIFEPFFTTRHGATGLGLSVSRRLVESFGGRLWVEPGHPGATFRFTLPTAGGAEAAG